MRFLCLVYVLVVSYVKCSFGFPFFIGSIPKSIISRYNTIPTQYRTIPTVPASNQYQRRRIQTQPKYYEPSDRFDKLMFSDDQYIEQRKIDDMPSDESSDLHPIYVLPPPNFQPIVYPTSRSDGVQPGAKAYGQQGYVLKRQIPYEYPHGVSSWIFGGLSGIQRGSYWEQLSSDLALHTPVKSIKQNQPKRVVLYLKSTEPKGQPKWTTFPTLEAHSVLKEQTNTIQTINNKNKNKNKVLKTKLPVGLSSFFLGGMRGISGRHWEMPSTLVSQVEFMPNDGKVMSDKERKKIEYKPAVQFDDDNDFYNYNVIKVDK